MANTIQINVSEGLGTIGLAITNTESIPTTYEYGMDVNLEFTAGQFAYFIAIPEPGYVFAQWVDGNANVWNGAEGTNSITNHTGLPNASVHIQAKFTKVNNQILTYTDIVNKGYSEGFDIDWNTSDVHIQNTMKIFTNDSNNEKAGFKFLFKQLDNKQIHYLFVYVVLENYNVSIQHTNGNYFYLKINDNVQIDSKPNNGNLYSPTPTWQITQISNPTKGLCQILYQNEFFSSNSNQFSVDFKWVNTQYENNICAICSNTNLINVQNNAQNTYNIFNQGTYLYSNDCNLNPQTDVTIIGLQNNTASYGQTITIRGLKYVKLTGANVSDWENWKTSGTSFDLSQIQPNNLLQYPTTLKAITSDWNN